MTPPQTVENVFFTKMFPIKNVGAIIDRPLVRRNKREKFSANTRYFSCFNAIKICNDTGAQ